MKNVPYFDLLENSYGWVLYYKWFGEIYQMHMKS